MSLDGWGNTPATVDNVMGGGVMALSADRSLSIGFSWESATDIKPGTWATVVAYSPLTLIKPSDAFFIDGGVTVTATLAPSPVPEPTTIFAGLGAVAFALLGLRSRRGQVVKLGS